MVYLRQFASLPAGFLNTTDTRQVEDTGYLDYAANIEVAWGLAVVRTTKIGDVFRVILPTATTDIFYGFILKEESIYKDYNQTENTFKGTQLIPIIREAQDFWVATCSAVTGVNDPVVIETAAGANRGKLKNNNTGSTGIVLSSAKWLDTATLGAGKARIEFSL
jgi:hypothetical protein